MRPEYMEDKPEMLAPIAKSPLDPWRGSGKNAPDRGPILATEKKKPGRKKKSIKPMKITISDTPIILSFD